MSFIGNSYLELWQCFCSAEQNHLCIIGRGYYEEQFCEISHIKFGPVAQEEMLLKEKVYGQTQDGRMMDKDRSE